MFLFQRPQRARKSVAAGACALMGFSLFANADVPHEFQPGKTAVAGEINANFDALAARINSLEAEVRDLRAEKKARIDELETEVNALRAENTALANEFDFLTEFSRYVQVHAEPPADTAVQGPIIRVQGANLQIVNAAGAQDTPDGTGNLVVGFAAARSHRDKFCSDGTYDNQPDCVNAGEVWADAHNTGSHNIVGGVHPAYSSTGGIVTGNDNAITNREAIAIGGSNNVASGSHSAVTGGENNEATGSYSSISGGKFGLASGLASSISGGGTTSLSSEADRNHAAGMFSSITGGGGNYAQAYRSTITGGKDNHVQGSSTGGDTPSTANSTISGGANCTMQTGNAWGARHHSGASEGDC